MGRQAAGDSSTGLRVCKNAVPFASSIKRPTISSLTVDIANKELSCVDMKPLVGSKPMLRHTRCQQHAVTRAPMKGLPGGPTPEACPWHIISPTALEDPVLAGHPGGTHLSPQTHTPTWKPLTHP